MTKEEFNRYLEDLKYGGKLQGTHIAITRIVQGDTITTTITAKKK